MQPSTLLTLLVALLTFLPSTSAGRPVFAHYMVGDITSDHALQDIRDAQALGIDAFALNLGEFTDWATRAVDDLFAHAEATDFKLFFSFDFAAGFTDPMQFAPSLLQYLSSPAHYTYNGTPLVSTFSGSAVPASAWSDLKSALDTPILLMPAFYDIFPTSTFFTDNPSLDGAFNWDVWPFPSNPTYPTPPTDADLIYQSAASSSNKLFMTALSPFQFKHLDSAQNWYRAGKHVLSDRMSQVLSMQPDMLELITWNDAGEGHYMGNVWPESLPDSVAMVQQIKRYADPDVFPHTAYREVLGSFIQAWKRGDTDTASMAPTNGKTVQGAFWHHTLLKDPWCATDGLGPPDGIDEVEDSVAGVVLVEPGQGALSVVVTSGGTEIGRQALTSGFNPFNIGGMVAGKVVVEVVNDSGDNLFQGTGGLEVVGVADLCNYNMQVVALAESQ